MVFFNCTTVALLLVVLNCSNVFSRKDTCDPPNAIENAVLKPEFQGIEQFNHTDKIEYDCELGYNIEGRSRQRTCNSGIWSRKRFRCTLRTCPYVGRPENGRRLDSNNGAGEFTEFECNTGYKLRGNRRLLCRTDANWSPSRSPTCDPILCPEVPSLRHGRIFQDTSDGLRNNYESVAEYSCDEGYLVNGKIKRTTRRCQADGTWDGSEPFCEIPRCEHIRPFYGGDVVYYGDRIIESKAFYRCADGFSLDPSNVESSECMSNLQWTPDSPQCFKMAKVKRPKYGYARGSADTLLHSDSYTVSCRGGYELYRNTFLDISSLSITNDNGTLTPEVPECEEERCNSTELDNAIVKYQNGTEAMTKVLSRTKVDISCRTDHEFYNFGQSVPRYCRRGVFIRAPKCEEKRCWFTDYPGNSDTKQQLYKGDHNLLAPNQAIYPGETIEYLCRNDDYELFVNLTKTYLKKFASTCSLGRFDKLRDAFPVCIEKRCHFDLSSNVCFWTNDDVNCKRGEFKVSSRSSVNLKCKDGYSLYRSEARGSERVIDMFSIECSKGSYLKDFKCIPDGVITRIEHYADAINRKVDDVIYGLTCRFSIFWFTPCKDPCIVPDVPYGFVKNTKFDQKVSGKEEHGTVISVQCDAGYKLSRSMTTTCKFGEWVDNQFPNCSPKPCDLTFNDGEYFWTGDEQVSEDVGTTNRYKNGTTVHIECKPGYSMKYKTRDGMTDIVNSRRPSTCILGKWTHIYSCYPEPCTVPVVQHASLRNKKAGTFESMDMAKFVCDEGYHFTEDDTSKVDTLETTCNLGNWTRNIPHQCNPDSCNLALKDGSKYFSNNVSEEITIGGLMAHGTDVLLECLEGFNMFDGEKTSVTEKEHLPVVACHLGKWINAHFCWKQCSMFNVTNGRVISGSDNFTVDHVVHGDQVTVKCEEQSDLPITCNDGHWKGNIPDCSGDRSSTTGLTTEIETTTLAVNIATEEAEGDSVTVTSTIAPDDVNKKDDVNIEGCILSGDERFTYTDATSRNVDPGTWTKDETVLTVTCTSIDLYSLYTDYDYNDDTDYGVADLNISCSGGKLSKIDLECPEVDSKTCMHLEHGKVKKNGIGYYIVSCDPGYSLNLFRPDQPNCNCVTGELECTNGGQKPVCKPDACILPYDIDDRLSVFNKHQVSLTGGSTVDIGDIAFFNCSKVDEQKYEPVNRRFKCENGQWIEDERDKNWKHGNNGAFPKCREAICEPNCTNGGLCFKDDNCKCQHLTRGRRCEEVICDPECTRNGGQCVDPGICGKCPSDRYGTNCGQVKCRLDDSISSIVSDANEFYQQGEKIDVRQFRCQHGYTPSSSHDMECRHGGIWSEAIKCIRIVCDPECTRNGGECVDQGVCGKCPSARYGTNCGQASCRLEDSISSIVSNSKEFYRQGEKIYIRQFRCPRGHQLSSSHDLECRQGGIWSEAIKCIRTIRYLIQVQTGTSSGAGTAANVYIYLHGDRSSTGKLYLRGSFKNGNLDEVEVDAPDVTPINKVTIGRDGRWTFAGAWQVQYVSVAIKEHDEYYSFRPDNPIWVDDEQDETINMDNWPEECAHTFGQSLMWYPRSWNMDHFHLGKRVTEQECKQSCVLKRSKRCNAVLYNTYYKDCHGFVTTDSKYFKKQSGTWISKFFRRNCS